MADSVVQQSSQREAENDDSNREKLENADFEPSKKRPKLDTTGRLESEQNLEERLSGILCCAVCLDLPKICYQCANGHLMCAGCFNHLLADARLKDETATCPNCRCEIVKTSCLRNLAVEKAASELPIECQYCNRLFPRNWIHHHEQEECQERPSACKFERIGCPWCGPFHELKKHEEDCTHPQKSGNEILDALQTIDKRSENKLKLYENIFSLLSCERISFNDLQLRPYRTDDFITKLFYETSRFSAFNQQWVIKARVNNDQKDPTMSNWRTLSYQLVLKSRLSNPMRVHYMALKGPYGEIKVNPVVFEFEFSADNVETEHQELTISDPVECNRLLAAKTINIRLILFQLQH